MAQNTIGAEGKGKLSDAQISLLCEWFDGEAGWLSKVRAQRLVSRNLTAASFVEQLRGISAQTRALVDEQFGAGGKVDLWSKIAAQIEIEERAAVYTKRPMSATSTKSKGRGFAEWLKGSVSGARGLGVGFGSGVMTAALVLLTVLPGNQDGSLPTTTPSAQGGNAVDVAVAPRLNVASGAESVSYSPFDIQGTDFDLSNEFARNGGAVSRIGRGRNAVREVSAQRAVSPVEMDWVRSDGRLLVMRDPNESNPVIYVAPRSRMMGVINGGTGVSQFSGSRGLRSAERGAVVSRRSSRADLAPFDDTFGGSSSAAVIPQSRER
jgi:hypothetical protein